MKKTILIFAGYYKPAKKYGGPTTSIQNLVNSCNNNYDFKIIALNHDVGDKKVFEEISADWNKVDNAKVLYVSDNFFKLKYINEVIKECNPSLIYLTGIFAFSTNWRVIAIAKLLKIPVLLAPRGELCNNAFKLKKIKKSIYMFIVRLMHLYNKVYFHSTSIEETEGIINKVGLESSRIFEIPNIPKAIVGTINKNKNNQLLRIVFISRIHRKKNLAYAIKIVNLLEVNAEFDIYGPIEDKKHWEECSKEIKKSPPNIKISYKGELNPEEVGSIFQLYDCFLFPTLSENYGHVIIEAMYNSCPLVLSKGTTPWDDIHEKGNYVVELYNKNSFVETLTEISQMNNDEYDKLLSKTREYLDIKLDYKGIVETYIKMFEKLLK